MMILCLFDISMKQIYRSPFVEIKQMFCYSNKIQHPISHRSNSNSIIQRFRKYKQKDILQNSQMLLTNEAIDNIFSSFTYSSVIQNLCLKQSVGSIATDDCLQNQLSSNEGDSIKSINSFQEQSQWLAAKKTQLLYANQGKWTSKPIYIRQFSKLNSILPNYQHPLFNMKKQMQYLTTLIKEALIAIKFVFNIALRIDNNVDSIKFFQKHQLTLDYFMLSNWQNNNTIQNENDIIKIKPYGNFINVKSFDQMIKELNLLFSKIERYKLVINLTQSLELGLYLSIRENLFQIEEKLIACSNLIYSEVNSKSYPDFYYQYYQILHTKQHPISQQKVELIKQQFKTLQYLEEPLTCSQIGKKVWNQLLLLSSSQF